MKSKKKESTLKGLSREEIRKLALDMRQGVVFTDRQCKGENLLPMVFMPLALVGIPKNLVGKVGLVYEYMDKAGPRSINGMPMFFSCRFLIKANVPLLNEFIEKFKKAEEVIV